MPTKDRYSRGHRGSWKKRPKPDQPRTASRLDEFIPGQGGRVHNTADAPADWGSDSTGDGSEIEGAANPNRNGGTRYYREMDVVDREDRAARGVDKFKYAWRSITGPTPEVSRGDLLAARLYLRKIYEAIDHGGWTSSEAAGLYIAKKVWQTRARGEDPRYNEVGNRQGGLTKQETANVHMRQIMLDMKRDLEKSGRSGGD